MPTKVIKLYQRKNIWNASFFTAQLNKMNKMNFPNVPLFYKSEKTLEFNNFYLKKTN